MRDQFLPSCSRVLMLAIGNREEEREVGITRIKKSDSLAAVHVKTVSVVSVTLAL